MQLSPQDAAKELLARRRARESLLGFTCYTMPKFEPGEHHAKICAGLEAVERGEIRRLMIEAPPRHTKSELASRRFPAWYVGKHPDRQLITSTYSGDFAQDFGRDVKGIVSSDEYRALFPNVHLAEDSKAKGRWHTSEGGVYYAVGVNGPITGRGAHVALIDDPVKNRQDADSEVIRDSAWKWYTSTLRTRLMPGGAIILVMTRWHEDDLAGRLLSAQEKGGEEWTVISLPAIDGNGKALWPAWYPVDELRKIERAVGPRDWLALYQQQPTAEDGDFFRREWFRDRYSELPHGLSYFITGDFATKDDGGDFTEFGVWGVGDGNVYAVDWWSGQSNSLVWADVLIDLVKRWKPLWFIGETGPISSAMEPVIKRRMSERRTFVAMDWLSHGRNDKSAKARAFQAMCAQGIVRFPEESWAERVIDQLLKFPAAKHDDAVDVCGMIGRHLDRDWARPNEKPVSKKLADYVFQDVDDDPDNWKTA